MVKLNCRDKLYCQQVAFAVPQWTPSQEYHKHIPKCAVKTSDVIITESVLQRCICTAVYPKMYFFLPLGEKLVWLILFRTFFIVKAFLPLAYEKQILLTQP